MITWIILVILLIWCIYQRVQPDGKIEGQPLGMPRGTVRAMITILIVSFPLQYLIFNIVNIPGLILNALFIVVAFYFEARKPGEERIKRIIREIKKPEKVEAEKEQKKPLYLPKYSVRGILVFLLTLIILFDMANQRVAFTATNTIIDIVLIIGLYMFGSLFRGIGIAREKKKTKILILNMQNHQSLSKYEIIEKLMEEKLGWWARKGKSFLSLFMLISVIISFGFYSFDVNEGLLLINIPELYTLTFQGFLLLLINIYYGIRD